MSLKESWQLAKRQRQQAVIERQQTVQHLLSEMGQARQLAAITLQSDLDIFVQNLKHQTAELLADAAADRVLTVQQVEVLRSNVQCYLGELTTQRQQQAEQLWQDLQESRTNREIEMQQLFDHFLEFRAELHHFHQTLHDYVWGTGTVASTSTEALPASQTATLAKSAAQNTQPSAEPTKKNGVKTSHSAPSGTQKAAVDHEKAVYTFLHESRGARLTQIEAALNLNRFQTVDALRSLIKKGLITQRDRVYLLQEEV